MVVAIYSRGIDIDFLPYFERLMASLKEKGMEVVCEGDFAAFLAGRLNCQPEFRGTFNAESGLPEDVKILLSIGGDGTFLDSVIYVKDNGVPVLGVNSGHLGFLANVPGNEVEEAVSCLSIGQYHIEQREMLRLHIDGKAVPGFDYALNEIGILKAVNSTLLRIHAYIGEIYLTTYWADGLIVATPTGSTAYSLSGGGPILSPDCRNIILTPVCAHNLSMRPLVVPNDAEIVLRIEGRSGNFMLTMDSRMQQMRDCHQLSIRTRETKINVVKLPRHNYYETLRNKLMWGEDRRNEGAER